MKSPADNFDLLFSYSLPGPLLDYSLSPNNTQLALLYALYNSTTDSFHSTVSVIDLLDPSPSFSHSAALPSHNIDFVALRNSGELVTSQSEGLKYMFRVWGQQGEGPWQQLAQLEYPASMDGTLRRVVGLAVEGDSQVSLLVGYVNRTGRNEGLIGYGASETSPNEWQEEELFYVSGAEIDGHDRPH